MNLILDIGNTRIKAGIFDGKELTSVHSCEHDSFESLIEKIDPKPNWSAAISSVSMDVNELPGLPKFEYVLQLDHHTPIPIRINYETPESLGLDRICGAVGANASFLGENCLVIDIGTCVTYDLIDGHGVYQGGGISPGFEMRLKAMNQMTKRLPLVEPTFDFPKIGRSTEASILFGAGRGMITEINGLIETFKADYQQLNVILTGGSLPNFERHIENPIFAAPNFILNGLNIILLHNQGLHA